nr:hypothetical protein [uncultured Leptotrichia sp.]
MKTREARGKFNIGKSIDERSEEVKTKKLLGIGSWILKSCQEEGAKSVLQYL